MFCKSCEYPLWNIAVRQCPECGRGFKPSEFDFRPRSVRFCCPHCRQHYFGTSKHGHLMPSEFDCLSCGKRIAMDEMVLLPAEGLPEDFTREQVPWVQRKKIGFFRAWFGTIAMAMIHPGRLIRALPVDGQSRRALWFALLTNFCFMFIGIALGWVLLIVLMVLFSATAGGGGGGGGMAGGLAFMTAFMTLIPLLFFALLLFLWAIAAHVLLRLTGATRYGARRTFDALCYANGANILAAIPCLGMYFQAVAWVWAGVSASIMLRETHGVSGWRAAFAVFLPPIAAMAAVIALVTVLLGGAMSGAWTTRSSWRSTPLVESSQAVRTWAAQHQGEPPRHVAQLIDAGVISPYVFVDSVPFSPARTTIAGVDLLDLDSLSDVERAAAIERVLAAAPPGTVAHRVGSMVFTYHGITFPPAGNPNPDLWVGVNIPDNRRRISVVEASGATRSFSVADMSHELQAQNAARAAAALPPLPDLTTLKVDQPAVAP